MNRLSVNLCGIDLKNPVIPASGTFGYGREFAGLYDLNVLGSIAIKGTTLHPREGNAVPRIAESASGMLNAVGLQNPGAETVVREELPWLAEQFHAPVLANVSGFSVEEYALAAAILSKSEQVGWLEVNISCPNVHGGGMSFGTDPCLAGEVTAAVKEVTDKPVIMKLTPNVTDLTAVARACEAAGADGLCLINTLLSMRIDLKTRRPILANVTGGLSGPAVFPVALRALWQVYEAVSIPLIGVGGVTTAEDVVEMMLDGATAVEVGAANLRDPWACPRIIEELPAVCDRLGIGNLRDIVGCAHAE